MSPATSGLKILLLLVIYLRSFEKDEQVFYKHGKNGEKNPDGGSE